MDKNIGGKIRGIVTEHGKTNYISDGDLHLVLDWYANLIDFFEKSGSLLTGLIVERRSYENMAFARGWDINSY